MTMSAEAEVEATPARSKTRPAPPPETPPEDAVSGLLDVAGSSAFVRTSGFQPGPDDVFVPAALIKQYGLRRGDQIDGAARPPGTSGPARNGQARNREKRAALTRVDTVNAIPAARAMNRPAFDGLTPLYADQRIRLEA